MSDPEHPQGGKEELDGVRPESVGPSRRPYRNRRGRPGASVNMDELREIIALIRENGFAEFELEHEGFRVRLRREAEAGSSEIDTSTSTEIQPRLPADQTSAVRGGQNVASTPAHPGALAETAASEDQGLYIIPSPIVGTFYRSSSPNADSFVKIGTHVEPDTVVCIIEAMKLMNEIQAETSGEVTKIYVENGQPVEYGQPLFGIKK
jgi:acetyl-CoA carboxylase biotin carboxyl carrier protein